MHDECDAAPFLRRLEDINPLEDRQACMLKTSNGGIHGSIDSLHYLLSRHFDLFGLIDSGEAIDAATITPNPYA